MVTRAVNLNYFYLTPVNAQASGKKGVPQTTTISTCSVGRPTGEFVTGSGSLPPGMKLAVSGSKIQLVGTPASAGTFNWVGYEIASNTNPDDVAGKPDDGETLTLTVRIAA